MTIQTKTCGDGGATPVQEVARAGSTDGWNNGTLDNAGGPSNSLFCNPDPTSRTSYEWDYLYCHKFGFAIPTGATISTLRLVVWYKLQVFSSGGGTVNAWFTIGKTPAVGNFSANWITDTVTYGSAQDTGTISKDSGHVALATWFGSLSEAELESADFGAAIYGNGTAATTAGCGLYIDAVQIEVAYVAFGAHFVTPSTITIQPGRTHV